MEELNYVDFLYANKIRFKGSSTNFTMDIQDKKVIFGIRRYIELTGESVSMPIFEFAKMCDFYKHTTANQVSIILNNIQVKKLIIMPKMCDDISVQCYGTPRLVVTTRDGREFEVPEVYSEDIPSKLAEKYKELKDYYVYVCKHNGKVVYVGKGTRGRISHCLSGSSSSEELNALVKSGAELTVEKVAENLTEEMAIHLEDAYIRSYFKSGNGLLNKSLPKDVTEYLNSFKVKLPF